MHSKKELPFIQISNPPLRFLIDAGANQSFISPEAVDKFYSHITRDYDPFEVTNSRVTSVHEYSISIPSFPELNEKKNMKLFIYKFHNYFDGLIGLDLLENTILYR